MLWGYNVDMIPRNSSQFLPKPEGRSSKSSTWTPFGPTFDFRHWHSQESLPPELFHVRRHVLEGSLTSEREREQNRAPDLTLAKSCITSLVRPFYALPLIVLYYVGSNPKSLQWLEWRNMIESSQWCPLERVATLSPWTLQSSWLFARHLYHTSDVCRGFRHRSLLRMLKHPWVFRISDQTDA